MNEQAYDGTSDKNLEKELTRERELRMQVESQLKQVNKELQDKDIDLNKYKHLQGKAAHYKHKSERLTIVRNILLIVCLVLVCILACLLVKQYESAKEMNALKKEYEPKPSNVPSSYYQEE